MSHLNRILVFLTTFTALVLGFSNCAPPATEEVAPSANSASKINTDGWSDSPFISRDGQRLYFMYSRYDFGPFLKNGTTPVIKGPDRVGLHKVASGGNPFDESDIYVATKNPDGTWQTPTPLGFNGNYGDSSGMEYNSGNSFIWLRGDGTHNYIVTANKNPDGSWTTPTQVPNINQSNTVQDNPHISAGGNIIYFSSDRGTTVAGKRDLFISVNTAGTWGAPTNLGSPFNITGSSSEDQPWVSPVSMDVYWNSEGGGGIMHCVSNGTTCTAAPQVVTVPGCTFVAEASFPDDMQTMYFGCGDATTFKVKIMYSKKLLDGSFGAATPVD